MKSNTKMKITSGLDEKSVFGTLLGRATEWEY